MSMYGGRRDINLFKSLNRELLHSIIEQQIGYYKPLLDQTKINLYGESTEKFWLGPVLIKCLIDRNPQSWSTDEFGPDIKKSNMFRFLKDDLKCANILTEVGDIILFNNDYYLVDSVIQNQLIVGKDPDYSYSDSVSNFGDSLSIILETHLTRKETLGIDLDRL